VRQDVEDGARLVLEVDSKWLPVTAAIWVHEPSLGAWRLVIAIPERDFSSPKAMYSRIQNIIFDLNLSLPLDRITVVSDRDPLIRSLRDLIQTGSKGVVEVPVGGLEVAGDTVDLGYGYHIETLRYRADLFAALQRNQPRDAVLRRAGWLDPPQSDDLDFILDNGEVIVFIEAKALSRPLSRKDIDRSRETRHWTLSTFRRLSVWLVISQTGFTREVTESRSDFPSPASPTMQLMYVKWSSERDDQQLRETLNRALHRGDK